MASKDDAYVVLNYYLGTLVEFNKILIRNATVVPAKKYTKSNQSFEINLQTFSTIVSYGEFKWKDSQISHITFDEILTTKGHVRNSLLLKVNNKDQIKVINDVPLHLINLLQISEIFINKSFYGVDPQKNIKN
ncbi:hypothetical protein TSAR_012302 [Trichomalopsis sarcophagae]|uniref:Uncharacterized protein n=1 Tax=Trichomalopsis sarcophagae TaxID=543379 RepID=A0A232FNM8_9HYME|nr:hypothetical protein TSAR_012302 [Trichomalopsis sarcophagae]